MTSATSWTLKLVSESPVTWAISVPILVSLCLSVLELGPMYATDARQRQTSDKSIAQCLHLMGVKKKKKISHRHWGPLRGSSSPFFGPWSRRGLNPIKPVYDPDRPDGRLNLTASAFNQLGQYTSSPGRTGYCYAELVVFFLSGGRNHRQYSLRLPMQGWPGWVGLGGWLRSEIV